MKREIFFNFFEFSRHKSNINDNLKWKVRNQEK
jgi:hypothetical protein